MVKHEKDLGEQLRGYWLKAVAAIELRNFGYAIDLLQTLLKQEPEFLTGRQMLRRTAVTRAKAEKKKFFNLSTAPFSLIKAQREVKKNPAKAIELVEKVLETQPYHTQANMLLKDASIAAQSPDIAIFAMETLLENDARDVKVLRELGRLYFEHGHSPKAVDVYNRITEIHPTDLEAVKLGKDAAARASIQQGGWNEAESYRDLIKDKEAAVSLEQRGRMQLSAESIEQQIAEIFAQHEADPDNVDLAKRLGLLHDQRQDWEGAIAWFQYAADLTEQGDPELVRKVADLKMRQLDKRIREDEAFLSQSEGGSAEYAAKAAELESAKRQRADFLIEDARRRLDRNPTDLQLRFELGEHLAQSGRFRDALPELQRARQNPNARLRAMNLLGQCYRKLGMLDLAAKQLEDAARETVVMDAVKKEIVYNLGLVHEQNGDRAKCIAAMKEIYEADYGYRDVAQRVESSYNQLSDKV